MISGMEENEEFTCNVNTGYYIDLSNTNKNQNEKVKSKNMDTQNYELLEIGWYIMNIPYVVSWTERWVLCKEPIQGPGTFLICFKDLTDYHTYLFSIIAYVKS